MLQQKKYTYLFLITLFGTVLRLLPTLLTGMPYSPDAWPLIKDLEVLLQHTPVSLTSDVFTGSKHYWPSVILFGSIVHQVTGLGPIQAMALFVPLASSLLIPIFYVLVEKLLENTKVALSGALLIATLFPFAMFTAEVKREVYATPLYLFLIFLFIGKLDRRRVFLFSTVALVLVLAHPLPPLVLVALFGSVGLSRIVGDKTWRQLAPFFILFGLYVLHFYLYGAQVFEYVFSFMNILVAGFFGSLLLFFGLYAVHTPRLTKRNIIAPLLVVAGVCIFLLNFFEALAPTPLVLPPRYLFYFGGPIFLGGLIGSVGYQRLVKRGKRELSLFWLLIVGGIELFALFGVSNFVVVYRMINFFIPPLAIILAAALYKKSKASPSKIKETVKTLGLITLVVFSLFNFYASFALEEPYMGYQLKQTRYEYRAGTWLSNHYHGHSVMTGDKARFLLGKYFNYGWVGHIEYYLSGERGLPKVLFIYRQMEEVGYLHGSYPHPLPKGWRGRAQSMNKVYSNGGAEVYYSSG